MCVVFGFCYIFVLKKNYGIVWSNKHGRGRGQILPHLYFINNFQSVRSLWRAQYGVVPNHMAGMGEIPAHFFFSGARPVEKARHWQTHPGRCVCQCKIIACQTPPFKDHRRIHVRRWYAYWIAPHMSYVSPHSFEQCESIDPGLGGWRLHWG